MNEVKDAFLRMVRTALFLKKMAEAYSVIGLNDNPHHEAYGDLAEAIYSLVGEHVDEFNLSATYVALTTPYLTDERRMELLWAEYVRNHPDMHVDQPKPLTISREEIRDMVNRNGGYMTPEGDWS